MHAIVSTCTVHYVEAAAVATEHMLPGLEADRPLAYKVSSAASGSAVRGGGRE